MPSTEEKPLDFQRVLFDKGADSVLPGVLAFLEPSDLPQVFGVNHATNAWYTKKNKDWLTGCDIAWGIMLVRDYGNVHGDFLFGGDIVDTTIITDWEPLVLLRKCLFFHCSSKIHANGECSHLTFRQTMPALYAFFAKNPINTPLCTMWKVEMYDHDFSEVTLNKVDEIVNRLDLNVDDHEGFRVAYKNMLKFIVSKMTDTGGMLASLDVDRQHETSGIKLNIVNTIGHSIDVPLFEDRYQGETSSTAPREERLLVRDRLEQLNFTRNPARDGFPDQPPHVPRIEEDSSPYDMTSFCRYYIDRLGRMCVFDWVSKGLIPVTFESSGTFITNLSGADGNLVPFLRVTPLFAFNPQPFRLRCSRTETEAGSRVPCVKIPNSMYTSRLLRHNELCDINKGVTTQRALKPGTVMRELPHTDGFKDGRERLSGSPAMQTPATLLAQENPLVGPHTRSLSLHDVKHIYYRECLKNLYPLFAPYGGPKTAGLFTGCYALHGNEVVQMTLEPFVDPRIVPAPGQEGKDSDEGEGGEQKCVNRKWVQIPGTGQDPPPEHYVSIDISNITEDSDGGKEEERHKSGEAFGIQLQGLKISGDPNVPGGKLTFCFNAMEALPSHTAILSPTEEEDRERASSVTTTSAATNFSESATAPSAASAASLGTRLVGAKDYDSVMAGLDEGEKFGGALLPRLVESMLVPEQEAPPFSSAASFSSSPAEADDDAAIENERRMASLKEVMQNRVRAMFHDGDNPGEAQAHPHPQQARNLTAWMFRDRVTAEFAGSTPRDALEEIFPTPVPFPLARTEHVLYVLSGHAVTNEVQGWWNPEWAKVSLIIYDRHVYEEEDVVFTIVFEDVEQLARAFYIDFKPFKSL